MADVAVGLVTALPIVFGAAIIGARLEPRVRGTRLWFPVVVLFASIAIYGGMRSLSFVAEAYGDAALRDQAARVAWMAIGFSVPAFANFATSHPRPLTAVWVRWGVPALYVVGLAYAVLVPTRLIFESFTALESVQQQGPLQTPLTVFLIGSLVTCGSWTAWLALRGSDEHERRGGRALTLAVVLPLAVYAGLLGTASTSFAGAHAIDFYYLLFLAALSAVLLTRTLEPPVPSTFRSLVESLDEGVVVVDGRGSVLSVNSAGRQLLGLGAEGSAPRDATQFHASAFSGHGETAGFVERTVKGVLRGRMDSHEGLLEGVGPRRLTLRWRVFPLGRRDAKGEAEGALLMVRDETGRRALEKRTEESRDVLDLVIRMLGHDLKAPLTVMTGYIDLDRMRLDASSDPATALKVKADLEKLGEAVVSMHMMIGNARALSRLAATGDEGPARVESDLTKLVKQAIDLLAPAATARQVKVERHVEEGVRLQTVPGFDSVPRNLIDNAVKYTPPGGAVTVSLAKAGDAVRLKVADTGPGVPPEKRDQMFRKFERLGAERGSAEGHGLGLSIVAKLVELSGGKIQVADRDDATSGTVIIVDLPLGDGKGSPQRAP
jgi:signal transduction histidine kinase